MINDLFPPIEPVYDTQECMREHGISVPRVFTKLRRFGVDMDDVKRIVIGNFSGKNYSIAVLIEELTMEKIKGIASSLNELLDEFGGKKVLFYPLGQDRVESFLFNTKGFYTVYPDEGRI
ncbi:hypothetical protein GOV12_05815 [Candidatus Pacearchaeota archaeon]|nr:hypothetical protein [Candidatus Pacearchaeota archaeon]